MFTGVFLFAAQPQNFLLLGSALIFYIVAVKAIRANKRPGRVAKWWKGVVMILWTAIAREKERRLATNRRMKVALAMVGSGLIDRLRASNHAEAIRLSALTQRRS